MSIFDGSLATPGANISGNQHSGDTHLGIYTNFNMATPFPLEPLQQATPGATYGQGAWDY